MTESLRRSALLGPNGTGRRLVRDYGEDMTVLRQILMTPIWCLQIFGMSKSFKANPVLGSHTLNRMGLHAARLVLAHAVTRLRLLTLSPLVSKQDRETFKRDGFIIVENFLDPDVFQEIDAQVRNARGEVRECIQGDTLTHRILLDEESLAMMPAARKLIENKRYERLLKYCGSRLKRPLYYVQSIKNGYRQGRSDPQKVLHSDTFHPTMKAWFFLDDVGPDNGPFTYVPGSHRLTMARLKWEYRRSIASQTLNDGYSEKGSMRADLADLHELGLPHPKPCTVRKNTLVVADTHGFHCRGQAAEGSSRLEIWAYSRTNPFNPLPGLGLPIFSRIEHKLAKMYWAFEDRKAARRNVLSSWHPVPAEKMHKPAVDQ